MRLKPGELLVFDGTNWKLAGDSKWLKVDGYTPNYAEKFMGVRLIGGIDYAVFQCMDGDFVAQPKDLCIQKLEGEPSLDECPEKGEIPRFPTPEATASFNLETGEIKVKKKVKPKKESKVKFQL
jgi:hypothetical protein